MNNWWPFSGDVYLIEKVNSLIKEFGIKTIIETGTWKGKTAQLMSTMVKTVYTIEVDEETYNSTPFLDEIPNVHRFLGDSPQVLDEILSTIEQPVLFFLDAHWRENWPLRDELRVIAKHHFSNSVIIIHDIYNPLHPDFNYDTYEGVRLDWEYIQDLINQIYNSHYTSFYNEETSGDNCGVLFITTIREKEVD